MQIDEFQKTILDYYHAHPRMFPWRETADAYRICVSEIMLQQTQTERVLPKYNAWIERFPTVCDVAHSPLADIFEMWIGLGYNRRARFLHETCKIICDSYAGFFPDDPEILDSLPGIGPYTARAITTFAFSKPEVFIETNIRSVFIFFFFPDAQYVLDADIMPIIAESLYSKDPRTWYYALMDYGAELKKTIKNPNRRSASYTKQSKFEGSLRQARGAVLRMLLQNRSRALALSDIATQEGIDAEQLMSAAQDLCAEGLLSYDGSFYFLPE